MLTNRFLIAVSAFCLHTINSIVVTKYDPDTITDYFNHVRHIYSEEAVQEFLDEDPKQYCHDLREADVYESISMAMGGQKPKHTTQLRRIPVNLFEIEHQSHGGHRTGRIRFKNNNQTHTLHSFQCVSLQEIPEWYITPGFVPHSNFLFEVEPSFHHVISRETDKKHNVIPTRLIAIIDKSANNPGTFSKNKEWRRVPRDPLCDLNPILQFRICAIINDAVAYNLSTNLSDNDRPYRIYLDRPAYVNYKPQEYKDLCEIAPIDKVQPPWLAGIALLHCDIVTKRSVYLASNLFSDPSIVFYIKRTVMAPDYTTIETNVRTIPLLEHFNTYKRALS